ncbi:MAG: AMP-binding protein [Promethearchaeota archaeon]
MSSQNLLKLIENMVEKSPNNVAIAAPGKKSTNYKDLLKQIYYTVKKLSFLDLEYNDRVAIILSSGPEVAVANLAVSSKFIAVPLNPRHSEKEFFYFLKEFKIKAIITNTPSVIQIAKIRKIKLIELVVENDKAGIFRLRVKSVKKTNEGKLKKSKKIAFVMHTSGTTSVPKIVPLSHINVLESANDMCRIFKLTNNDNCLNVMPLFHIHGLMVTLATLYSGGTVICTPQFNKKDFFLWLDEFCPTWYTASPTIHQAILSKTSKNQKILKKQKLRFIRSSSAPLSPETTKILKRTFQTTVAESYGMTEATLQITCQPLPPFKQKLGSAGKSAGPDIAVINKDGKRLGFGKNGEIIIRGKSVIKKYENNTKVNKESFLDGWLRTGDLGHLDKDGFLFIRGRIKEMINKGGENISPREIDEVLIKHPNIEQAVTFSMPHTELGEDIVATVILKNGSTISENEIRVFLKDKLANFKIPTRIIMVDSLLKTAAGKIKRIGLYEELKHLFKTKYIKPSALQEKDLAKIWMEILGVKKIGIKDNFFEFGGDSLKINELINRMNEIGFKVTIGDLLDNPTIFSLVKSKNI